MIRMLQFSLLLIGLAIAGVAGAQLVCQTPYGSCPANAAAANGAQCSCASPNGSLAGRIQPAVAAAGPQPLPTICCTPAGRIPFVNASTPVNGACTAPTIRGPVTGQACY